MSRLSHYNLFDLVCAYVIYGLALLLFLTAFVVFLSGFWKHGMTFVKYAFSKDPVLWELARRRVFEIDWEKEKEKAARKERKKLSRRRHKPAGG